MCRFDNLLPSPRVVIMIQGDEHTLPGKWQGWRELGRVQPFNKQLSGSLATAEL